MNSDRHGGGGTVGPEIAARAQADGYTVLMGSAEALGMTQAIARHGWAVARARHDQGRARTPLMPDARTMAELVGSEFVLGALVRACVPAGTPADVVDRSSRELTTVSQVADFRKNLVDIGQEVTEPLTGEAYGRTMRAEAQRWRELAQMAGVKHE